MTTKAGTYTRNLLRNWICFGANMAIMLFLTPFIVRSLGESGYGVWMLLVSVGGYFYLLDIGMRQSVLRHINLYRARKDHAQVNEIVNSAVYFLLAAGGFLLLAAVILGHYFSRLFPKIPSAAHYQVGGVLILLSIDTTLNFISTVYWTVVLAHEQFGLRNRSALAAMAVRTVGTVFVLHRGYGLAALAAVVVSASLLDLVLSIPMALHQDKDLRLSLRLCTRASLTELLGFGAWSFLDGAAQRVIAFANILIVGWFLGPTEVAIFGFGPTLVQYGRGLLYEIIRTFEPDINKQGANPHDRHQIQEMTMRLTRVVMFFSIPVMVGFMTLGRDLLVAWLRNPNFSRGANVLFLLALAQIVTMSSAAWRNMLMSLGHVRMVSLLSVGEGVANLVLSVVLVHWGVDGIALGCLIPAVIFSGIILPVVGTHMIGLRPEKFFISVTVRWLSALLVSYFLGVAVDRIPWSDDRIAVLAKLVIFGGSSAVACWFLALTPQNRHSILHGFGALGRKLMVRTLPVLENPNVAAPTDNPA